MKLTSALSFILPKITFILWKITFISWSDSDGEWYYLNYVLNNFVFNLYKQIIHKFIILIGLISLNKFFILPNFSEAKI